MRYQPPFSLNKSVLTLVDEISEAVGHLDAIGLVPSSPQLRKGNRVRTIASTLAIEGNTLGLDQVSAIIDGKRVAGPVREIAEVHGAIRAYENLEDFSMSEEADLLAAHGLLMGEVLTESGAYRRRNVGIQKKEVMIHIAPSADMVPRLMRDLLAWLGQSVCHPLIASSAFHYELEFIHPFVDGNGRMGRLWQTLILSRWKPVFAYLPLESVIKEQQEGYYRTLREADALGDCSGFIEFMLRAVRQTCYEVRETAGPEQVALAGPEQRRERMLALMAGDRKITAARLAECCRVSSTTVTRDIDRLKKEKRVMRMGSSKSGYWRVMG